MNHYEVLEISANANQSEIKSAYRRLVKRYHPDINPDPLAAQRMIHINEAYEILSDTTTRNLYDLFLQGVPVKTVLKETTPEQKYRTEYIRNRIREQRNRMEQQFLFKQRFYRYFRILNIIFFGFALLLTFDYYYSFTEYTYETDDVILGRYETYIQVAKGGKIATDRSFYKDYKGSEMNGVVIRHSSILYRPQKVRSINGKREYFIHGTIYSFRNTFSVIIFIFSLVVIGNKRYTDFRLSCGLLSFICFLYMFLMLTTS
ncbi:J domain-containing protein [Ekhidna sp.]